MLWLDGALECTPQESNVNMSLREFMGLAVVALGVIGGGFSPALCDDTPSATPATAVPTAQQARQTVERSLGFLEHDALKWRKEHECATCHHGTLTVWALNEAQHNGYEVKADLLKEMAEWTKARWVPEANKPRDTRPGWSFEHSRRLLGSHGSNPAGAKNSLGR